MLRILSITSSASSERLDMNQKRQDEGIYSLGLTACINKETANN